MSANAFIGKASEPTAADLSAALGPTKPLWDGLIQDLAERHGVAGLEWRCYSPKSGWALRLKRGSRTIVWFAPFSGCFEILFILGARAVEAARQAGLPLDNATKYPEGTGVRLLIKRKKDLATVMKFAAVKLAN